MYIYVCMYVCMYKYLLIHTCTYIYIYIYIWRNGNESNSQKKIEKQNNPKVMNLLEWKVNVKKFRL